MMNGKVRILLKRIFSREPTLWFAAITGAINMLVTFKLDYLSAEQASLWITLISAVFGAVAVWKTRPVAPQVFTYLASSVVALVAAYGVHLTQEQVGQWNLLALAIASLITRNQVSPEQDAHKTGVLGPPVQ